MLQSGARRLLETTDWSVEDAAQLHFGQMEVKTIVHQLLRRHRITAPAADLTSVATSWDWTSLPKPLDDLPIVLEPIS